MSQNVVTQAILDKALSILEKQNSTSFMFRDGEIKFYDLYHEGDAPRGRELIEINGVRVWEMTSTIEEENMKLLMQDDFSHVRYDAS